MYKILLGRFRTVFLLARTCTISGRLECLTNSWTWVGQLLTRIISVLKLQGSPILGSTVLWQHPFLNEGNFTLRLRVTSEKCCDSCAQVALGTSFLVFAAKLLRCGIASEALRRNTYQLSFQVRSSKIFFSERFRGQNPVKKSWDNVTEMNSQGSIACNDCLAESSIWSSQYPYINTSRQPQISKKNMFPDKGPIPP